MEILRDGGVHRRAFGRSLGALGLALATAAAWLALGAGPSQAAAGPTVLSPRDQALVTGKELAVRVRGAREGFRVYAGGADVTKRFGPASRRGIRTARLRRGRDFKLGVVRVVLYSGARQGRRFAARSFVAARRRGALRVRQAAGRRARAPLHLRGRASFEFDRLRVRVNGKRVVRSSWFGDGRRFAILIGADERLRYGVNRVTVTAISDRGRYAGFSRRFSIRQPPAIAGAGPDRRARAGQPIRLDGRSSLAFARRERLRYRWQIVQKPRGSKARLKGASTPRPRLVTDRRGTYRVQLVVSRRRADGARGSAVAGGAARDEATVEATPAVPPLGMSVDTIGAGGAIALGGKPVPTDTNWLQIVALDRTTLEVQRNLSIEAPGGYVSRRTLEEAADAIDATNSGQLVILSGGGREVSVEESEYARTDFPEGLADVLGTTGVGTPQDLRSGQFSVIGVPDASPRTAYQNDGGSTGPGSEPGALTGYLQAEAHGHYTFVSPQRVEIDTQAAGTTATQNAIQIGGATYESQPYAGGGFHLLVLDQALNPVANQTYPMNDDNGNQTSGSFELAGALSQLLAQEEPSLVVLQSFGQLSVATTGWLSDTGLVEYPWTDSNRTLNGDNIPNELSSWGSNASGWSLAARVGQLAGPGAHDQIAGMVSVPGSLVRPSYAGGGFTAVATIGDPEDAFTQSQVGSGTEAPRVVGTLSLDRESHWQVDDAADVDAFNGATVSKIAYQQPLPWPQSETPRKRAANAYIAEQLGFRGGDVRVAYYETRSDWASVEKELEQMSAPSGESKFRPSDFKAVKAQLLKEVPMVAEVRHLAAGWESIFTTSVIKGYIDLHVIANQVLAQIEADISSRQAGVNAGDVAARTLGIAAGIAGAGGLAPVAGSLGAISNSILLAGDLSQEANGAPTMRPVLDRAEDLGQDLAESYAEAQENIGHVADILVSDWGKLQAAKQQARGEWALDGRSIAALEQALTRSAQRESWEAMLPLAYGQYLIAPASSDLNSNPLVEPWNFRCMNANRPAGKTEPFSPTEESPKSWVSAAYAVTGSPPAWTIATQPRVIAEEADIEWRAEEEAPGYMYIKHEPHVLPPAIGNEVFGPLEKGGVGIDQLRFLGEPEFERWPIYCEE